MGGGSKKDESLVLNSTNVFSALSSLKKKKKSTDKEQSSSKGKGSSAKQAVKEPEKEVFWAPAPLTVKSWADVDDEDDDDYYATTAPLGSAWATSDSKAHKESEAAVEESESDEEGLDEVDDEVDEEHENEPEPPVEFEPAIKKPTEALMAQKETERQLSKKELKKKGLEELDAVLAELGLTKKEASGQDESFGVGQEKKSEDIDEIKKVNAPGESKSAKKKKKKDKSSKEGKESSQEQPDADVGNRTDEAAVPEKVENTSAVDVKERLKKMASAKKKKSAKDMDAAARAAAIEAAARSAKLAAAKKKEKNHYNQQPVR